MDERRDVATSDPVPDPALQGALLAEVAAKADLVWVSCRGQPARALWHVWHDNAVVVVTRGREQPDPGLADGQRVELILRSKDKLHRVLTVRATAHLVPADSPAWHAAVKVLHPKRLNASDGEAQPARWLAESAIWQLRADLPAIEGPGYMSADAHLAEPVTTQATTVGRLPFHVGSAKKRKRR